MLNMLLCNYQELLVTHLSTTKIEAKKNFKKEDVRKKHKKTEWGI